MIPALCPVSESKSSALRFLHNRLNQAARLATEGNAGRPFIRCQQLQAVGIGATGQLQGTRRSQWTHRPPESHSRAGGARTDVTAHWPAVQLPERSEPMATQTLVALPELTAEVAGELCMPLKPATHRQTLQGQP